MGLIIRNRELLEIIFVRILKDFLICRVAPEILDGLAQDALIVSSLAAVNDVPQHEPERQSDEKLGFDGVERQRRFWHERALAQGGYFEKSIFDVVSPVGDSPIQWGAIKFIETGNPIRHADGRVDSDETVELNQRQLICDGRNLHFFHALLA